MVAGVLRVTALASNSGGLSCFMINSFSSRRGYDEFVLDIR
jgi:hypothetical protein